MEKYTSLKNRILIISFAVIMVGLWLIGGVVNVINHDYYVSLNQTTDENRRAQEIEYNQLWNTGSSISGFVDDRIPFRNIFVKVFKKFSGKLDTLYQKSANKIGSHFYQAANNTQQDSAASEDNGQKDSISSETQGEVTSEDYYAPVVVNDVLIGRQNFLFMYGENSIDYYQATNILSDEEMAVYADKVNQLKSLCDAKGKELYMIFVPDKDQVYSWFMPTLEVKDEYKRTARLVDYLNANTSVPSIYPRSELIAGDGSWQDYHMYDSHWNSIGAFIGVQSLYGIMGKEVTDPHDLFGEYHAAANYDLAVMVGWDVTTLNDQYQYDVEYRPEIEVNGIDTEAYICRTNSSSDNMDKFVLVGDSFRKDMIQYISKDYQNCTFVHRSNISEADSDILNADVIVLETVERQDFEVLEAIDHVITLLQ